MAKRKKQPTFRQQNIPNELYTAWKSLRRMNDPKAIKKYIDDQGGETFSISTINNALGYGFVHSDELRKHITAFYASRKATELAEAQTIL